MGFRRITFLLAIMFAMSLAACGDNKKKVFDDAGVVDMPMVDGDMEDAPPDAGCPVGQMLCGTSCVDLKTDNDHCGDCDTDCGTGTCQTHNGITTCCASGLTNCDGTCVDLTTDPDHCGSCQTDCGTGQCQTNGGSSICCAAGQINCNGVCVDPTSDEAACGGCVGQGGTACTGLTDTCCNSQCVDVDLDDGNCGMCGTMCDPTNGTTPTTCHAPGTGSTTGTDSVCCAAGETNCDGTCVSLVLSDSNCGGCGIGCTVANTHCQAPDVGATPQCCLDAENNCNGTCSDPDTDNNNCGGCSGLGGTGQQCNGSDSCKSGLCCGPQELTCGNQCVDPDTNPNNCGGCAGAGGVACGGATPVCSDGQCVSGCDVSETLCGNACVTTSSDPNNCGACGTKCSATEVCNAGSCVPTTTGCTGGKVLCDGACVDPMTDEDHCGGCPGTTCDATDTCDGGLCCDAGTVNLGGICCPTGWLACDVGGGVLQCKDPTDDATCGSCTMNCGTGSCTTGTGGPMCCAADETRCGSSCVDLDADNGNCGTCGTTCTSPDTCTPTTGTGTAECCNTGANELNCDGACIDKLTDPNNCGACDTACGGTNICSNGHCCALGETAYTVGQNTKCCPAGQFSCDGMTCINGTSDTACGTTCGTLMNCAIPDGKLCDATSHMCVVNCGTDLTPCPGNQCIDTDNDPNNCGGCGSTFACPAQGQACIGGICQACAVGPAGGCPTAGGNVCVDTQNSNQDCGTCGNACDVGETCQAGNCCATGTTWCASANACVDTQSSSTNCGACGNACGAGESCQSGSCECSFGQHQFPTPIGNCAADTCYTSTVDPTHCGLSCTDCTFGPGNANRVCVNGTCQSSCPAPLTNCDAAVGDPFNFRHCVNTGTDSLNCGSCGFKCPAGQGCSNGGCVPLVINPPPTRPTACIGGGPPISVPTGGGSQTCTGNLGSVSFLFGLCSRTSIGPISRDILTDAFHSNLGGYKASCTPGDDSTCVPFKRCTVSGDLCTGTGQGDCDAGNQCVYPIKCVANTPGATGAGNGTCVGGGVGVNGRTTQGSYVTAISNTGTTKVGGDFWTFGTVGLQVKGTTVVYLDHKNGPSADANTNPLAQNGPIDLTSKSVDVFGNAEVKGAWISNQQGSYTVQGILKTAASCSGNPAKPIPQVTAGTIQCQQPFTDYGEPCGKFDGTDGSLIPIAQTIVPYFKDPAHNNNADIGLKYNALDGKSGHLDLPCGVYYLNTINTNATSTIYVRGRVALVVGGSIRLAQPISFDLDPGSSLDIFVGGVLDMSQNATLGSPAYPARTRLYFGSAGCGGSGTSCKGPADCCGGICSTCPVDADGKPTAPCSGLTGTCTTGSSSLDKAVSLSSGGDFNGLIWAGYGTFTHQSPLEMYGSIYTGFFDASGVTTIHYDKAATELGEECPPIPPGSACESARDCDTGQACVGNTCGSCTLDSQCIPPGRCVGGTCTF